MMKSLEWEAKLGLVLLTVNPMQINAQKKIAIVLC